MRTLLYECLKLHYGVKRIFCFQDEETNTFQRGLTPFQFLQYIESFSKENEEVKLIYREGLSDKLLSYQNNI